ncbi:MAG: hypothetical protein JSU07_09675 [Bacteroidetes bacterium]|nr:hypothetical protein [Bacteroidota bacterium]
MRIETIIILVVLCNRIYSQTITTVAGIGTGNLPITDSIRVDSVIVDNNSASFSKLYYPYALATDNSGNVLIAEHFSNMVRCVKSNDIISIVSGNGKAGNSDDNSSAKNSPLNLPSAVAVDALGNVYVAEWNSNKIRKIDTKGILTTIAGTGNAGYSGNGGPATSANISSPSGIAIDGQGNIYITEYANHVVRKIDPSGIITLVAGTPHVQGFSGDGGRADACQLNGPHGVTIDDSGNIYIVDSGNDRIRKVSVQNNSSNITTIAGNGVRGFSGDGGSATSAQIAMPQGVAVDASGNVYFTDMLNNRIRKVNTSGIISTIAGDGIRGLKGDNGLASASEIAGPIGIAISSTGAIYFTDTFNHRIRVIK